MRITDPAAPYPDPGSAFPKYNPKPNLPISNNKPVRNAPTHTYLHFILASGKILNIIANRTEIVEREIKKLAVWKRNMIYLGQCASIHLLMAARMEVITNDIKSKKAIESISPNEKRRALRKVQIPDLEGWAFTSQMMFSDFCS